MRCRTRYFSMSRKNIGVAGYWPFRISSVHCSTVSVAVEWAANTDVAERSALAETAAVARPESTARSPTARRTIPGRTSPEREATPGTVSKRRTTGRPSVDPQPKTTPSLPAGFAAMVTVKIARCTTPPDTPSSSVLPARSPLALPSTRLAPTNSSESGYAASRSDMTSWR